MNVLLINGSPHPKGCTYTALNMVAAQLEKNGLSTHMQHLGNKAEHGCMACGKCAETGQCVFTDDPVNEAIGLLLEADALVVGSPVYYAGPNGALCAFLDRVFFMRNELYAFKPAAAVVRITRAVSVQTTMVSANTSKIPHIPCSAGSFVSAALWANTEAPSPASLVNTPLATPTRIALATP